MVQSAKTQLKALRKKVETQEERLKLQPRIYKRCLLDRNWALQHLQNRFGSQGVVRGKEIGIELRKRQRKWTQLSDGEKDLTEATLVFFLTEKRLTGQHYEWAKMDVEIAEQRLKMAELELRIEGFQDLILSSDAPTSFRKIAEQIDRENQWLTRHQQSLADAAQEYKEAQVHFNQLANSSWELFDRIRPSYVDGWWYFDPNTGRRLTMEDQKLLLELEKVGAPPRQVPWKPTP
jgi:hypothetical protein